MAQLISEIQEDINWRVSEIAAIKTIPLRYNLLQKHKDTLTLHSIPSIYSLWEGYLKSTFELLTTYINKQNLDINTVHMNLLTHSIENKCKLGNERKHFKSKHKLVSYIFELFNSTVNIDQGIPSESNANFKVTNRILERFNIHSLSPDYEKPLNRLLLFRNKIAHGENSIQVTRKDIDSFSLLVENLMYEILLLIENYVHHEQFKKIC